LIDDDGDGAEGFNKKITTNIDKNINPMAIQNRSVNPRHCI
jgi:hypothetical protein